MKVLLAGTRSFGIAVLRELHRTDTHPTHRVVGVCAPPGDRLHEYAYFNGFPVMDRLNHELTYGADLIVAAHSHDFISTKTLNGFPLGGIGYHPSLLPLHRGKDAVRWTVEKGDKIAGGSVYWLTKNVDGGPIAAQDWCFVRPGWDASDLWKEALFPMGVRLIRRVLDDLEGRRMVAIPQDESLATWEPSWDRPPLFRPDLPAIGAGPAGYEIIASREQVG